MRLLLLLGICGCAAGNFVAPPRPPVAEVAGVHHAEGRFDGALGLKLYRQSWRPASGDPRAVLVIVHGLKDHSARYAEFADRLAQRGIAVHAFDLRGHGSSEGARVYVSSFDEYVQDLETFVALVRKEEGARPLFVLGHSMGGAIVTRWALAEKPQVAGVLLSGAALMVDAGGFKKGSVKVLGSVLPTLAIFSLDLDRFSRDPSVVQQCKSDPLVDQGAGPARTAAQLVSAIDFIAEHMEDMTAPLLIMHGSADAITPPDGSRELARRARSADKTLKIYDGLYHDLLHEPEREQVMSDAAAWMDARIR
jgi:alpha-beta hydrolase superfamily lysophospholipase